MPIDPPCPRSLLAAWMEGEASSGAGSGPVLASSGETWVGVVHALKEGRRGLPGGDSLAALLARHGRKTYRGRRKRSCL